MRAQFLGDIYAFEELSCRQFGENVRESLAKLSNAMSLRTCSLDFTQLDMGTNGNLRYSVYLIPSFSLAPKDINVLFRLKICFLKKIYCGKLVTSTEIFSHQSQWIDRCRQTTCCSVIVLRVKPAQKLKLRTLFVPESLKEA